MVQDILSRASSLESPQQPGASAAAASRLEALKRQAAAEVDSMAKFTQQTNDLLFSFSELGFQEFHLP